MNRIDKIHINNFKFFGEEKPIELGGKHLLLYGENGSGKSTIYWSLYTLFEAPFKNDDVELTKYFEMGAGKEWSLVNVHAAEVPPVGSGNYDSFISVTTTDNPALSFRLAKDELAIRTSDDAKLVNFASDFIQYKLLQSMSNFWHKKPIDLFEMFVNSILQHVQFAADVIITREGNQLKLRNAFDVWQQIRQGPEWTVSIANPAKKIRAYKYSAPYDEFNKLVNDFNSGMNKLIDFVNQQTEKFLVSLGYSNFKFRLVYKNASFYKADKNYSEIPFEVALQVYEYEGKNDVVHRAHSFLNEAKLNAIAISIRLAVLYQKISHVGLKFIVLDDLLISLDMRNREKVLNLFLSDEFSQNYQLLIFTHDRHFYEMTKRKIKDNNQKEDWVYYEMYAKELADRTVPYWSKEEGYLGKALHFYNSFENDVAANFLRKEAESFCKNFLPTRLSLASDGRHKDLSKMLTEVIDFARLNGIDVDLIKVINKHRQFVLNPGSHDSYDVPKFRNELMLCHDALTKLDEIRILKLLLTKEKLHFEVNNGTDIWRVEITLDDELRLLQEFGNASILLKGRINYTVSENGAAPAKGTQSGIKDIGELYNSFYARASASGVSDFWDGIIITETGDPLRTLRAF